MQPECLRKLCLRFSSELPLTPRRLQNLIEQLGLAIGEFDVSAVFEAKGRSRVSQEELIDVVAAKEGLDEFEERVRERNQ